MYHLSQDLVSKARAGWDCGRKHQLCLLLQISWSQLSVGKLMKIRSSPTRQHGKKDPGIGFCGHCFESH